MADPLFTTHQTRRTLVLKADTDNDTKLYKLILTCNVIMTMGTSFMQSIHVPFQDEKGGYMRTIVYSLYLLSYAVLSFIYLVYRQCSSYSKHHHKCTAKDVINTGLVDISLIIAGVLYLAGDNIRMLYEEFETKVPIGAVEVPAREIRSYVVAMSLVFMIVSRVAPLIGDQIYSYRKIPEHCQLAVEYEENFSLDNFWRTSKQTLYVPAGLHDKWKTDVVFKLELKGEPSPLHAASINRQILYNDLFTGRCVMSDEFGCDDYTKSKIEVEIYYFLNNSLLDSEMKFRTYKMIVRNAPESNSQEDLVLIRGERPTHTNKKGTMYNKYLAKFVVKTDSKEASNDMASSPADDTIPGPEIQAIEGSALTKLFGAYYKALDYVVIIDALYTTILDEITQGSKRSPSIENCPLGQISITFAILLLVNILWFVAIGCLLPCGYCCCIRYKHVSKLNSQLWYKPKVLKCVCWSRQTDQTQDYHSLENQQQFIEVACCPCSCNSCKIVSWMAIGCFTSSAAYCSIILIIICIVFMLLSIILLPIGLLMLLIFIIVIVCICCCRCCKCYREEYCGTVFLTFLIVFLMMIYLPVYMISDNSWPWICFITEWYWYHICRNAFLFIAFAISASPTVYKHVSTWANGKLHDLEKTMKQ